MTWLGLENLSKNRLFTWLWWRLHFLATWTLTWGGVRVLSQSKYLRQRVAYNGSCEAISDTTFISEKWVTKLNPYSKGRKLSPIFSEEDCLLSNHNLFWKYQVFPLATNYLPSSTCKMHSPAKSLSESHPIAALAWVQNVILSVWFRCRWCSSGGIPSVQLLKYNFSQSIGQCHANMQSLGLYTFCTNGNTGLQWSHCCMVVLKSVCANACKFP